MASALPRQASEIAAPAALSPLAASRAATDDVFSIIREEALYDRPIAERHRIVFYIGHLEAFDRNLFAGTLFDWHSGEPEFDRLFAFGIDPLGEALPTDRAEDWPSLAKVLAYVRRTRADIDLALARGAPASHDPGRFQQIVSVAIEHRLMHAETLAYMFQRLPLSAKIIGRPDPDIDAPPPVHGVVAIPAGRATLGRSEGFGWDNEFPQHVIEVPAFEIDRYKITNAQFLKFVEAGGYADPSLWSKEDWAWREAAGIEHPSFWTKREGDWKFHTMFAERPLPPHWPVYVSQAEASAYAKWVDKSLPTEAQFHRAAYGTPSGGERLHPWGEEAPMECHGNFDFARFDSAPVNAYPSGESAFGVSGMVGNGWEWTSSLFAPFVGFEPFDFYPAYSANFFDGKHFVMKGAAMRTAAPLLRRSFRNWFQPHYPHVPCGFRCVSV